MAGPKTEESGRRAARPRLAFRLAVALCLGVAAVFLVAGQGNIRLQRAHMIGLVQLSAERNADTIRRSTREAMLRNNPEEVHRILDSIGAQEGIDRIRIFDKEGRIRISTRPGEIDHAVDKQAEQCYGCHAAHEPLARLDRPDRIRIFDGPDGGRILGIIAPIHNEPDCTSACHAHSPEQQVIGVLDVQLRLDKVDEQLAASEHQLGLGLLLTVVAALLLAGFLVWRMVLRPVRKLTEAARTVRGGDLSVRVQVHAQDEIGEMAESWNEMLDELVQARRELEEWGRTLEARVEDKSRQLETAHRRMVTVEKMASLGKLAAVVAHEINNPLAGIGTFAKLLAKKAAAVAADPAALEDVRILRMIEEEAARCGKIVRNLLLFSRTPGARFTEASFATLVERCVTLVRHKADLQEVRIQVDLPAGLPAIVCDESQIQQMLLVLVMNAIEAMPEGGSLTVAAAAEDGALVVKVSDTGCGIPPGNLDRIFEPFFTTKEQGKGVGLGLAVAYGIVSRHQGRIEVESAPGTGTVFTVTLPLKQPAPLPDQSDLLQGVPP